MQSTSSRRAFLASAAAAATLTAVSRPASASPAVVPVIWDGKKMYESFQKDGTGFSYPGPRGRKIAHCAIDPQCPDCIRLLERIKPLQKYVECFFYPISFLNIHSEPQGTSILIAKEPWKKLDEQHEHFRDPDFRGFKYGDVNALPVEVRNKVWTNTKLHRRCGCRAVPFGVFLNSKGEYVAFDENLTTRELAALFELKVRV